MISIQLEPISAGAFAAYGDLLVAPELGARIEFTQGLQNLRSTAVPCLSLCTIEPIALPFQTIRMERHVHSSQAFLPLRGRGYLVLVSANGIDDRPALASLRAFRVPACVGINYRAGTWHHQSSHLIRLRVLQSGCS